LSSLPGTIHSGYVTFITRRRSPSSMSHNAIFSVKLERPHGSIETTRKALRRQRQWRRLWSEFFIFLSLSCFLTKADGKREHKEGKSQRCARERKNHRVKKGESRGDSRLQPPALNVAVEMSCHLLDISVIVRMPPANLLRHLASFASHTAPAIIPSPRGA
jgi:hypothetical protein